jgi:fumarate hydratase, class II
MTVSNDHGLARLGAAERINALEAEVMHSIAGQLMLVTALSPAIGYDKASVIAHTANDQGITLREAALASGYISAADLDRIVNPAVTAGPPRRNGA